MEAERPHRGWVRLLTALVGILTVLAILSTWVDRQLFDNDQWGETSVEMLQNPKIQAAIADFAVDELYANVDVQHEIETVVEKVNKDVAPLISGPLASLGRQGIDKLALKALQTDQVQTAWRKANVAAHKTLVDVIEDRSDILRTSGGQVRLELRPLIIEIASQVGLEKQARDNVPDSVGDIHILDSKELATAQRVAKLIHGTALVSALLAMALLALTVFLARGYRWITLIWLAVALVIAAVVVLIVRPVAGEIAVDRLAEVDVQPAAKAAWNIATELLASMAWTVIWSALVLVAIAWLISPGPGADQTRRFLAVPFGRFPIPVFGLLGLGAFFFLITGAGESRGFFLRLMIVILAALGAWAFHRQLRLEYPDANFDGLRDFGGRTADSARHLWFGPLRGVTKIFGTRKGEREEAAAGRPGAQEEDRSAADRGGTDPGEDRQTPGAGGTATAALPEKTGTPPPAGKKRESAPGKPGRGPAGEKQADRPETPEPGAEAPTEVLPPDLGNRFELLERLGRLRESGVLSEEEFNAEKRRILGLDE